MIEAAGGVVVRRREDGVEVLVVHRPRYDDWSLPKGKLAASEEHVTAAVREIAEETGVRVEPADELRASTYPSGADLKRVRWWIMRPRDGDPAARPPDAEVDRARWVPADDAVRLLSYERERETLREALILLGDGATGSAPG